MYRWTDSDVGAIVDMLARFVGIAESSSDYFSQLLVELSELLGAESWRFEVLERDSSILADSAWAVVSRLECVHQPAEGTRCVASLADRFTPWDSPQRASDEPELMRSQQTDYVVVATECHCQSPDRAHPVIACHWTDESGLFHCVEFGRGVEGRAYREREQALLRVMASQLASATAGKVRQIAKVQPISQLSRRQREVLDLLITGKNCKQIAFELGLSVYTVNDYIKAIYRRYDVSCRAELLASVHFGA